MNFLSRKNIGFKNLIGKDKTFSNTYQEKKTLKFKKVLILYFKEKKHRDLSVGIFLRSDRERDDFE